MLAKLKNARGRLPACYLATAILAAPAAAAHGTEKVLHAFQGGNDGSGPLGNLIRDKVGNLYGTTLEGGGGTECRNSIGCGTVFQVAPDRTESVLHAFGGGCDGANPYAGLVADKAGNLYGTTQGGGTCNNDEGFGTVYKLAPDGGETVLYAFGGGSDGLAPASNLILEKNDRLYGTTEFGGNMASCGGNGCGTVFEVTPKRKEAVLYAFQGGSDGDGPYGDVIMDKAGNLYGTTLQGGGTGCYGDGCGTVFKIAPDGSEAVLYAFQGGSDGWLPQNGVVEDAAANLYGTTAAGGTDDGGSVFKVTPDGSESVLYSFQRATGGYDPEAGVILDKAGNLYGTTAFGGIGCGRAGCGVAYELAPDGTETPLYAFKGHRGRNPAGDILLDKRGDLYGTTNEGGDDNNGVVFELKR
ncbi:MAG TPA: choice-of-anchor tandem repeat GloVer-containing protein [Rhizomicrobium sp.]|jgi:uncharacterized repeat protein (TIGR03803 family)|nr:choice-of-anchor tandem repeat GloVer-containing protein [Rhizomicrobium sp.]